MQLFFIDESGTPPPKDKITQSPYFTLGGIIIPDNIWHNLNNDFNVIKAEYKVIGEIKWRYFAPNHTKENSLSHLQFKDKEQLRLDIFELVAEKYELKAMCVYCDVTASYNNLNVNNEDELYIWHYLQLLVKYNRYLEVLSQKLPQKENGLIISDNRMPYQNDILKEKTYQMIAKRVTLSNALNHIIEGAFIDQSHLSLGLQLADLVVGATQRSFKGDKRYFLKIHSMFEINTQKTNWGIFELP